MFQRIQLGNEPLPISYSLRVISIFVRLSVQTKSFRQQKPHLFTPFLAKAHFRLPFRRYVQIRRLQRGPNRPKHRILARVPPVDAMCDALQVHDELAYDPMCPHPFLDCWGELEN